MAIDVSALSNYTKENAQILITAAQTSGKTGEIIMSKGNVLTGIKTSEKIGVVDQDVVFQDGDGCGFNAAGDTRITQREIVVGNVKIEDSICVAVLEKKFTQLTMRAGTHNDAVPPVLEKVFSDQKVAKIESAVEVADWQGDKSSGNANLNKYDGFLKLLDTSVGAIAVNARKGAGTITATTGSTTVTGVGTSFTTQAVVGDKVYSSGVLLGTISAIGSATSLTLGANAAAAATGAAYSITPSAVAAPITSVTGVTLTNIMDIVDSVILAIPEAVMSDSEDGGQPVIFMGWDFARLYLMALRKADLVHFTTDENMLRDGFNVPGFAVRIEPTPGLSGTGRIVAIAPKNMWLGVDQEHEEEEMDVWYEKKDDAVLSRTRFKRGLQVGFPSEVTQWKAA